MSPLAFPSTIEDRPLQPEEPSQWTIPNTEYESLVRVLLRAEWVAQCGDVADGYDLLLEGEERAQQAADSGHSWGSDLRECWAFVINDYCRRYDIEHPKDRLLDLRWLA